MGHSHRQMGDESSGRFILKNEVIEFTFTKLNDLLTRTYTDT